MTKFGKVLAISLVGFSIMGVTTMAGKLPEIKAEKYELSNGLDVILYQDRSIPVVGVNIWYHVGSKNEKPGKTGFAHLFEHMMFQGSKHHDTDYFVPLQKIGAFVNGSTSEDRTNYLEDVPSNYLELALWLESDRMGNLLPAMTEERLDNQRDVVKNERRQGLDNQPYGKSYELLLEMMFPPEHPYHHSVIGSMEDLSAASMEDIQEFFKLYYAPNNASLCITGDFDTEEAKALVEKYFGSITPGKTIDRMESWTPRLDGVKHAVAEDAVTLPRLYMQWHTPAHYTPGDAEFDLLANILGSGKTSRLYKELVYERQIAQDVSVSQNSNELCSVFNVEVTAKAGVALEEVEAGVDEVLAHLLKKGITKKELEQAKSAWAARFVRSLQKVGGFGGLADRFNSYNTHLGYPNKLEWDMSRYSDATLAGVMEYARRYIDLDRRAILHIVPQGELSHSDQAADRSKLPDPAPESGFTPPEIQRAALDNGLEILLVEDHSLPLVQANIVLKSGWAADPTDRPGAGALTAELLDEGTKSRNALQIADEAKRLGAVFRTSSNADGSFIRLNVLKDQLNGGLGLMADVLLNPTFPEDELERQRKIYLGRIQQEARQPFPSAFKAYLRHLYGPDHPYGQPYTGSGTEESINAITRDDLVAYYRANYHPNNAAIVIAGDITLAEAKEKLSKAFKEWRPGEVAAGEVPAPEPLESTRIAIVDKPGAPQSVIVLGHLGVRRSDPDHDAIEVVNTALGGNAIARLFMNLREDKGYTYGAYSFFQNRREVGAFIAYAQVQTEVTKESVREFIKEFKDILGPRPITAEELTSSKDALIKSFPRRFQTFNGIAGQLGNIVTFSLPDDEWKTYTGKIAAIDGATATKAAKDHLQPDKMLIVIVDDYEKIEPGLKELNLGEIELIEGVQ